METGFREERAGSAASTGSATEATGAATEATGAATEAAGSATEATGATTGASTGSATERTGSATGASTGSATEATGSATEADVALVCLQGLARNAYWKARFGAAYAILPGVFGGLAAWFGAYFLLKPALGDDPAAMVGMVLYLDGMCVV
jgi:hypothetical protein